MAALKAVGVEFDGRKAQAIREQHEAMRSGKGKEDTDGQDEEGGPSRQEQGARSDINSSDADQAAEEFEEEGGDARLDWDEGCAFGRKLEELKEYRRLLGEMLHVAPSHSQCVDRAVRSLATICQLFENPDARL